MQQNCKKGLCLAFLFSAMFLTGWEIAGMRSRQTKETAAVAYEAGNWGLGFGADSYLTKPFHTAILIQTAKALIRRSQIYSQGASGDTGIRKGPFTVDTLKMECLKNGEPLNFTAREMTLFRFLMEHPGQVFTKEQLYTQVWNEAVVDDNTITVYVKRIRNKIEDDPKQPRYLKTVRGIGYMLNV